MNVYEILSQKGPGAPASPGPGEGSTFRWKPIGNLLYTAGCGPLVGGYIPDPCRLGAELTLDQGQQAARLCVLNLLSVLHAFLGDLNRVKNIVKMLGFVASAGDFYRQPEVMNGASQLLVDLFGDRGQHARSAIGTNVLPGNIPVEIELIVEV